MMSEAWESAINVADFERIASERLDAGALGYFSGGAGDEFSLRDNVAAFRRWQIRPRMLVDVSSVSTETEILGEPVSSPILIAPVAFQRLVDPEGELAMARAAAAEKTLMCLSTLATARPAEVAEAAPGGRRWFQLYCFRDRAITRTLMDEAVASGFEAIVLTADAPRAGRRERDLRTGFEIPTGVDVPCLSAALGGERPVSVQETFSLVDASLGWDDLAELVRDCPLPVLVKGILTAEDATLAVEAGVTGIVVSNHGGRQLDCVAAGIDALPEVAEAADRRIPVIVDGGVRRGTDVIIALALGADAVMVGRPALWGLASGGEAGVRSVLEILRAEFELGLVLAGCPTPASVTSSHVARAPLRGVYSA